MEKDIEFRRVINFTLIAAVTAAVINNLYMILYESATGYSFPEVIHFGSVTAASVFPMILGGFMFFVLAKYFGRGKLIFIIIAALFTLASLAGPMFPYLPDGRPTPEGFGGMTLPMHIIAGLAAILIIPKAQQ